MESDARFYRRRANEELAAASRAVTEAARERRLILAGIFLDRLKSIQSPSPPAELDLTAANGSAFKWRNEASSRV